jgi:hypothetical protein
MRLLKHGLGLFLLGYFLLAQSAVALAPAETALRTFYALLNTQSCSDSVKYHSTYTSQRCKQIAAGSVVINDLTALTAPNDQRQLFAIQLDYERNGLKGSFEGYVAVFERDGNWLIDGDSYQSSNSISRDAYIKRYFPYADLASLQSTETESEEIMPIVIPTREIKIDIATQQLFLYEDGEILKTYQISSGLAGEGSTANSNKTPLGEHIVEQKIGHDAPLMTIFKARKNTGKLAELDIEDAGDLVTTRILWLRGTEPGYNSGPGIDSFNRYIYIHGTAEESKIGSKASHGCIRMYNTEVIELFDLVAEGTPVTIYADLQAGIMRPDEDMDEDMPAVDADAVDMSFERMETVQ